jgi:glycosyltransferase involved in cell wall biosynthesis
MNSSPFFSLVVPTFNRQALVVRAIASVLNQTFSDFELWVIDDGSTDDTRYAVESFSDPRLLYRKIDNSERGIARNTGIRASSGRYVTFLDSDDILYPNHLQAAFQKLSQLGFPECYHQGYVIMNNAGRIMQMPYARQDLNTALFNKGNIMSCMGVFVRRDILIDNLFHEDRTLAGFEDWELWIRLASRFRFHYHPDVTSALLQHEDRGSLHAERIRLVGKAMLFMRLITTNPIVVNAYGPYLKKLRANVYSYISLHLSSNRLEKRAAWGFLLRALREDKKQFWIKRTLAIVRNILLT